MTSPDDLLGPPVAGRLLAGLRPLRLVGRGGEGEVWEARDARGRRRALKLVRPDALAEDVEARSRHLLHIDHPALVRVYRAGRLTEAGLTDWGFVEMAYIDGPSLHDADPDPAVLDRLWPLAEALDLLHAGAWSDGLPLVHRDVKPANLVEDRSGDLVLVDPSTLRGVDATQLTRVGTPVFSAPEVMTGRIGPAADVYSFAVTVVALLTGARGARLVALLDEAASLDLPEGVALALSPSAGDRPASCRAVLEAGTELAEDPTILLPALDTSVFDEDPPWHEPVLADRPPTLHLTPHHPPSEYPEAMNDGDFGDFGDFGDEAGADLWRPRGSPWPWTAALVALVAIPLAALAAGVAPLPLVAAGALVAHLVATLAARTSAALAVLAPPVAWALLIGDRVRSGALRRAWTGAALTGVLGGVVGGVAWQWWTVAPLGRQSLAVAAAGALAFVIVVVAAGSTDGVGGALARLVLTPLWLAGALVVVAGALLAAPVTGSARRAGRTLGSIVEVVRLRPRLP